MNNPSASAGDPGAAAATRHAALFTGMLLQQANLALMCLGKAPRPDTKEAAVDLEAATLFIDTLEMLEAKTRGNLGADEAVMLRETLTSLRIAFVEAAGKETARPATPGQGEPAPSSPAPDNAPPSGAPPAAHAEDDARKKFVKRY
jgi:hypothetical protein